jgi:hypothetical protein
MRKIIVATVTVAIAFLFTFAGTAAAAGTVDPAGDGSVLLELAKPVFAAVMSGQYILGAALALVLCVALVRKYARHIPRVAKCLATDAGGALLTLVGSFGGALGTAILAGAAPSLAMAWVALGVAVSAAGGYSLIKKLGAPLVDKAPAWLRPFLNLVLWFFDHKTDRVEAEAKAAGDAAVAENPPKGAAGIVGDPRDWP